MTAIIPRDTSMSNDAISLSVYVVSATHSEWKKVKKSSMTTSMAFTKWLKGYGYPLPPRNVWACLKPDTICHVTV